MSARADRDRLAREPAVVHERIAQLQAAAARRGGDPCTRLISIELFHDQVTEELKRAQRHDLAVALLERDRYTGEHSKSFMAMAGAVARSFGLSQDPGSPQRR
ncbi:MAG TPA: hypothetical protein VF526_04260 [Solirubrobacteraceae bacterium]